jgi:cytochrome P450
VFAEAMRLYPPSPFLMRSPIEGDDLNGKPIGKNDIVVISAWLVHRHKMLWDQPDAFDAARFLPNAMHGRHKFQYIPFGAGSRICIAKKFAELEAMTILSVWLSRYRFSLATKTRPCPIATVTLQPKGGMPLTIEPLPNPLAVG